MNIKINVLSFCLMTLSINASSPTDLSGYSGNDESSWRIHETSIQMPLDNADKKEEIREYINSTDSAALLVNTPSDSILIQLQN